MKGKRSLRNRWLTIRLSEEEEKKLHKYREQTTCQSLSEYARSVLLKQPVTTLYRNASADHFLEEIIGLRRELNAIGTNFNQAVHRLHTLDKVPAISAWLGSQEKTKIAFEKKVDEILLKASQIHALWSQK